MNIVVVGGGTAGWLTALFAQKKYPNDNVFLIESEKIGILGAGEAGTVQLVMALDFLEISILEVMSKTKATIKNAAKFSNWSNNTKSFYHPFLINFNHSEQNFSQYFFPFFEQSFPVSHMYAKINDMNMGEYCFIEKLCENNLTPFFKNNLQANTFYELSQAAFWSISFDAKLMADFLCSVATERGIARIIDDVSSFEINQNGNISKIIYSNGSIDSDFVFDCTGFQRMIIGKFYKSSWKSYSDTIPVKKALPFFLPSDNNISPFIEATAMDYGWMWKTPLQHRYGCGYVFDSDFISEEEAKNEVEKKIGREIEVPKIFSFEPGSYRDIWIKNCLAVGLSSGFIEPLEATSLWSAINSLALFFSSETNIVTEDESHKNRFNEIFQKRNQEIIDFIYLHYVTNKTNTEFWKNFTKNNKMPDFTRHVLETIKNRPLNQDFDFIGREMFGINSYFYVLVGHDFLDKSLMNKYKKIMNINKEEEFFNTVRQQNEILHQCVKHSDFLNIFLSRGNE